MLRKSLLSVTVLTTAFALASPAIGADPFPKIGPVPAWVRPLAVPSPDPKLQSLPAQILVTGTQEKLTHSGVETYLEYVAVAQSVAGLQAVGTITVPWNTDRTDLTLHRMEIRRGDTVIDLLDPDEIVVLRRENNLEKAMLDGVRTVVLPTRGLRVGDRVTVAVSYKTKPSAIVARGEDVQSMTVPPIINRLERSFLVPDDVAVKWYRSPGIAAPAITSLPGAKLYRFVATGSKAREYPVGTPPRFKSAIVQATTWENWADISARMSPLFADARKITPGSPLADEADRIAATASDPRARLLQSLQLAQEQVRYVALLLGEGAYVPKPAEEVWDRRFGDCKGKTALLLALLDRFGISAEPMLVSSSSDDSLAIVQPSLALFDHVIVRARIGGSTYYLDATDYGQRTLEELTRTPFRYGLPVSGGTLVQLASAAPTVPLSELNLVWDGSAGFERKVPFTATLTLRGETAAKMRAKRVSSEDPEAFAKTLKNIVPRIPNEDLTLAADEPEQADGSYIVRFTGTGAMDWSPVDGLKGYRYQFDQSGVAWNAEFKRSEEANKELPLLLEWPLYQRATESVILPRGGRGFKIDARGIEKTVGGLRISRTVTVGEGRAVATSEFRHVAQEVSAAEARAAEEALGSINEDYAYIVAPGKIRPAAEEGAKP